MFRLIILLHYVLLHKPHASDDRSVSSPWWNAGIPIRRGKTFPDLNIPQTVFHWGFETAGHYFLSHSDACSSYFMHIFYTWIFHIIKQVLTLEKTWASLKVFVLLVCLQLLQVLPQSKCKWGGVNGWFQHVWMWVQIFICLCVSRVSDWWPLQMCPTYMLVCM